MYSQTEENSKRQQKTQSTSSKDKMEEILVMEAQLDGLMGQVRVMDKKADEIGVLEAQIDELMGQSSGQKIGVAKLLAELESRKAEFEREQHMIDEQITQVVFVLTETRLWVNRESSAWKEWKTEWDAGYRLLSCDSCATPNT